MQKLLADSFLKILDKEKMPYLYYEKIRNKKNRQHVDFVCMVHIPIKKLIPYKLKNKLTDVVDPYFRAKSCHEPFIIYINPNKKYDGICRIKSKDTAKTNIHWPEGSVFTVKKDTRRIDIQ